MYISPMEEKSIFQNYFNMTQSLFRTMTYALFCYPLFVALVETFHFRVFHFLNFETMKSMGTVFMLLTIVFFPLSAMMEPYFVRGCRDIPQLGKKLMYAEIANMALSETICLFGLVIYLTSANLKFFYLFFIISFIHLMTTRPSKKKWQKRLDIASKH